MNAYEKLTAAKLATQLLYDGANLEDLVHLIRLPDGTCTLSTPLPAGTSLHGYTERYYTLRGLLAGIEPVTPPSIADVDGYLKMHIVAKHPVTGRMVRRQIVSLPCFFSQREEAIAQLEKEQGERMSYTCFTWQSKLYY